MGADANITSQDRERGRKTTQWVRRGEGEMRNLGRTNNAAEIAIEGKRPVPNLETPLLFSQLPFTGVKKKRNPRWAAL